MNLSGHHARMHAIRCPVFLLCDAESEYISLLQTGACAFRKPPGRLSIDQLTVNLSNLYMEGEGENCIP